MATPGVPDRQRDGLRTINRLQCSGAGIPKSSGVSGDTGDLYWQERAARQAMRDAATLLRVLFGANIKWISTWCGAGWSRARSFFKLAAAEKAMRVTLLYAAATRPSALPHVRVCDTARKKDRFPEFGTGSKFFNDFSRARACTRARGGVDPESATRYG